MNLESAASTTIFLTIGLAWDRIANLYINIITLSETKLYLSIVYVKQLLKCN